MQLKGHTVIHNMLTYSCLDHLYLMWWKSTTRWKSQVLKFPLSSYLFINFLHTTIILFQRDLCQASESLLLKSFLPSCSSSTFSLFLPFLCQFQICESYRQQGSHEVRASVIRVSLKHSSLHNLFIFTLIFIRSRCVCDAQVQLCPQAESEEARAKYRNRKLFYNKLE